MYTWGERKYKIQRRKLKERDNPRDLGIDASVTLKWVLRK